MGAMQSKSDAMLLRDYAETGDEPAFDELIRRYTNLVYSAALRQTDSRDLAPEIAQRVFISLSRGAQALASRVAEHASLAGWLCRSTRNIALNLRRDEFRRHSRERQAMETASQTPEPSPDWESLRPILDEAMSRLSGADYDALVMRYFNNQDLRSVGRALGVTDDAAQKRVSRAIEKLRHYLLGRGISTSASALSVAISANAVQAAPAGLAAVISTAATVAGVAAPASAAAAATTAMVMTTLQKALVTAAIAAGLGAGFYESRRALPLTIQVQNLEQQQAGFSEQVRQLDQQRAQAAQQHAALQEENQRLRRDADGVVNLRSQLVRLQADSQELARLRALEQEREKNPDYLTAESWLARADRFKTWVAAHPEQELPEFQYLYEDSWLDVIKNNDLASDSAFKDASRMLRDRARDNFGLLMSDALRRFVTEHNGELPSDLRRLSSYLSPPMTEDLVNAYKLLYSGKITDVPSGKWPIIEVRPPEYPGAAHIAVGTNVSTRTLQ